MPNAIESVRTLKAELAKVPRELRTKVGRVAAKKGAEIIQREVKRRAPHKTGRLKANTLVRASKINNGRKSARVGSYVVIRTKGKRNSPKNAFYARFIADGWEARGKLKANRKGASGGRKTERTGKRIAPARYRNFMQRASKHSRGRAERVMLRVFQEGLKTLKNQMNYWS